jgi:hypothetical protein
MSRLRLPSRIRREVRQRCGFGCVICGKIGCEIHHLNGYPEAQALIGLTYDPTPADRLCLLCFECHGKHKANRLSNETVERANREPANRKAFASPPESLDYWGERVTLRFGTLSYSCGNPAWGAPPQFPLTIDGVPILGLRFSAKRIFVNALFFDEANELQLWIEDNDLVFRTDAWDVEYVGQTLTVRNGRREIAWRLRFSPPDALEIESGTFFCNGERVTITGDAIDISGQVRLSNLSIRLCNIGLAVGESGVKCAGAAILVPDERRRPFFGSRVIQSLPNIPDGGIGRLIVARRTCVSIEGPTLLSGSMMAHPTLGYFDPGWRLLSSREISLGI